MSVITLQRQRWSRGPRRAAVEAPDRSSQRVYAITFDLNQARLRDRYPGANHLSAYDDISRVLADHGYIRQQQSVYFGPRGGTSVTCMLAAQDVQRRCGWFRDVVNDIRMLRIEEDNDLYPALGEPELPFGKTEVA